MASSTLLIISLLILIIILLVILIKHLKGSQSKQYDKSYSALNEISVEPAFDRKEIQLSNIDSIVLQNSLERELVFSRPDELDDSKYKEINIRGTGGVVQQAGQGMVETVTLQELNSIAGNELYTSKIPMKELVDNYSYNDGTLSSIKFRSSDGTGIRSHQGFEVFDSSEVAGVKPLVLSAVAMQGMAIISGQYYLKQINSSLKTLGKDIEELKEIHESDTRGTLKHCRKRLMQISQMQHCSEADIMEIRDLANKAGIILEQYKDRYEMARKDVEAFKFTTLMINSAMSEYKQKIAKMRYLLQICMVADRIVDEARLAEFMTRRKINIKDPALEDVYGMMDDNYHNGFNARIIDEASDLTTLIIDKGQRMLGQTALPYANHELLNPIINLTSDLEQDVADITGCVRRAVEGQDAQEKVAILLTEGEDAPRFFVKMAENNNSEDIVH